MSDDIEQRSAEFDHRDEDLGLGWLGSGGDDRPVDIVDGDVLTAGPRRHAASEIVTAIRNAKEHVLVSSFLFADQAIVDALFDAATRNGVRVYVLNASEERLKEPEDATGFKREVYDQHRAMLKKLGGHVLVRSGNFHAKAVLVDAPRGPGFLLTANLTNALQRSPEIIVRLNETERRSARHWFVRAFWERAEKELLTANDALRPVIATTRWSGTPAPVGVTATYDGSADHHSVLRALVDSATRSITVASYGFGDDHPLVARIGERARSGVRVRVLAPLREKITPTLASLIDAGAEVLGVSRLHAKAIVVDAGSAGWVGSANLEALGLDQGFELGVRLDGERAIALHRILEGWAERAGWRLHPQLKIGDATPGSVLKRLVNGRFEDVDVDRTSIEDAGVRPADYVPARPTGLRERRAAHTRVIRWQIKPPKAAPSAT